MASSMQEIRIREQLAEINRRRLGALVLFLSGIAGLVWGSLRYLETATRVEIIAREPDTSTLDDLLSLLAGKIPSELPDVDVLRQVYHPHAVESLVVWIIGAIVLIAGLVGSWYYAKKRSETLRSIEQ
jgi:hypothetical protein